MHLLNATRTPEPLFLLNIIGLSDAQNTVAFWRLFGLQQRKQSLQEIKQSLQELHTNSDSGALQR